MKNINVLSQNLIIDFLSIISKTYKVLFILVILLLIGKFSDAQLLPYNFWDGSTVQTITSTGNVGIGITSPTPDADLHIQRPGNCFPAIPIYPFPKTFQRFELLYSTAVFTPFEGGQSQNYSCNDFKWDINIDNTELYFFHHEYDANGNLITNSNKTLLSLHNDGTVVVPSGDFQASKDLILGNNDFLIQSRYWNNGDELVINPQNGSNGWNLNQNNAFYFKKNDGSVGIGTENTFGYKLAVNGSLGCKEAWVEVNNTWPDYVFNKNINIDTLIALESYIKINKHLPEMPSAKEIEGKSMNIGEFNVLLLKKVEELTLYIIELKKENDELTKKINIIINNNKTD